MICISCKQDKPEFFAEGSSKFCEECFSIHMGCPKVLAVHSETVKGKKYSHSEYCRRIASRTSLFCPKHELLALDEENEKARKAEVIRKRKEAKKWKQELLEVSPLRADNPQVSQEASTGYEK